MDDLPETDCPPPYTSVDARRDTDQVNHRAIPDVSCDGDSPPGHVDVHTLAIKYDEGKGRLGASKDGRQLYHVGRYHEANHPDIIIYGGYDNHGPQLALAEFKLGEQDFRIYLGGLKSPEKGDWDVVRSASDGRLFHSPYYRFSCQGTASAPRTQETASHKLHWQKTHDSSLGASKFSQRDFKLVDEADDGVVAVYKDRSSAFTNGKISYRRKLDEHTELAALTVLMALLEKYRRSQKSRWRAMHGAPGW